MNEKPILSICIPTYNRIGYLMEQLETLIPQAMAHNVEICISDNCSTDGTAQYLAKVVSENPSLVKSIRQISNIGIDGNMTAVIEMGRGEYIYPIGDDDFIPNDILWYIIEDVKQGVDMLVLNSWHTDSGLNKKRYNLPESYVGAVLRSPELAFTKLWDKLPFGAFVASKRLYSRFNLSRYTGTSHAYSGAVWDGLSDIFSETGQCYVLCAKKPTVLLRGADKSWSSNASEIMLAEVPLWFNLVSENPVYATVAMNIKKLYMDRQTSFACLARFATEGQIKPGHVHRLLKFCNFTQKIKLRIISIIPISTIRMISVLCGRLKKWRANSLQWF